MSQNFPTLESVSAPEDAGLSSGHESGGSRPRDSSLYPRVLVSDGESRDHCPPLADSAPSGPPSVHGGSFENKVHLLDPRSAARRSSAGSVSGGGPNASVAGSGRRRMDSTFRNVRKNTFSKSFEIFFISLLFIMNTQVILMISLKGWEKYFLMQFSRTLIANFERLLSKMDCINDWCIFSISIIQ